MIQSNELPGDIPRKDTYVPKTNHTLTAYLLECRLREIIQKEIAKTDYFQLERATGISVLQLEEAIEDRVFLIDGPQLRHCLGLYAEKGMIALVEFLHQPYLIEEPEGDLIEQEALRGHYDKCEFLEEWGYPVEMLQEVFLQAEDPEEDLEDTEDGALDKAFLTFHPQFPDHVPG